MDYEKILESVKNAPKDTLKRAIFELDQRSIDQLKQMDVDKETERELIMMFKDRTFFEMLIVNALM